MSEAKHTSGPWEVHQGEDYLCVLRPEDTTDYAIHIPDGELADAKLIAAAPDLLEALKEAHDYFAKRNIGEPAQQIQAKLAAVISKATS